DDAIAVDRAAGENPHLLSRGKPRRTRPAVIAKPDQRQRYGDEEQHDKDAEMDLQRPSPAPLGRDHRPPALPSVHQLSLVCRTMHRKPTWQVDVSTGCAIRAAGR